MKFVWIVGINSSEVNNVRAVCATEEIARRELFKVRDEIIRRIDAMPAIDLKYSFYQKQKTILLNDNPQKWEDDNPYDYPYLNKLKLLEE